eukprot:4649391-Prorocentrum_lima.AAC.1
MCSLISKEDEIGGMCPETMCANLVPNFKCTATIESEGSDLPTTLFCHLLYKTKAQLLPP